jgi:DNA polymerase III alpha subunit
MPQHARGLCVLTSSPDLLREWSAALPSGALHAEAVAHEDGAAREALLAAARETGRPVVGTHRVFLDHPRKHAVHRLRLAVSHLKLLHEVAPGATGRDGHPLDLVPPSATLLPPREAAHAFRHLPGAARATLAIAERCAFAFRPPDRPRLPRLGPEALGLERAPASEAERAEAAYDRLAALCLEGVRRRYARLTPEVLARLQRELQVIQGRGFADYFLIVDGLARFAREQGIPAVGRGSAANSLVAYALGITSVDPLRHDLPFERFLSPARRDCPDIDLDLDWRGRDAVIRHAYDAYGDERVAMISTHVTFQRRSAVREAAKTLGVPLTGPDGARPPRPSPETTRAVLALARSLEGLPRHLSIHVGGIVIGDGVLMDALPLERAAKGLVVTQYDMHGVEATGLVKIDLLGNRALAVVADVTREVRERTGRAIDLDAIDEEDAEAAALLRAGRTLGCFQVESPGMRNLVVRMDAHTQEDAMIALSLIRPGPAGSGMKDAYIRRRLGEEPVPSLHPLVDPLFRRTYGVMLYQEDTLRLAAAVAGFDLAQADLLRRALSKKRAPEDLPETERLFREAAAARGVPPQVVEEVWASIARFSAYAYNKAHAATYGRISWQALWLKARHPAEYLAAVLRNAAGFYPARAYVEEARRSGCRVELPCVNRSQVGPTGRDGALRLGLEQVKGLRRGTPESLVEVREATGPYLSPTDLLLRTRLEKHEAERLVLAGALDAFDRPRGELLWLLALDFERYLRARAETRERSSLFGPTAELPPPRHLPVPRTYTQGELLAMEVETLGLTATCHPGEPWEEAARAAGAVRTSDLRRLVGKRARVAGWVVTDRTVRVRDRWNGTREARRVRHAGRAMKFLMLEDPHGSVEVTVFPDAYARVGRVLEDAGPYLVTGEVREDHGALTLDAKEVRRLEGP